ncbi:sensor histidine kinase [Catalinimonas niigatensis]|uniref:sensor histidine kinase n=1 Tax=Catalinimonas niigatensis TaxID=1397264 RepID=UPI0026653BCF|nr:histidine kinase [Catalinimonas niigatensis]WPP51967.1 histidine kinase [Catalinimonas niigatensis]
MPLLILQVLSLSFSFVYAQERPLVLHGNLCVAQMDIAEYTSFYEDLSGESLPLSVIRTRTFRPFTEKRNERATFSKRSLMVTWLRFTIHNTHPTDTLKLLHKTFVHGLITMYENDQRIGQSGVGISALRRPDGFALPLTVPPLADRTYFVQVIDYIWSPSAIYSKVLSIQGSYELDYLWQMDSDVLLAVIGLLAGCLFFMSLYTFYSFFLTRDKAFLYYALYTLISFLFTLHHMDYRFSFAMLFPLRMAEVLGPFHIALITFIYTLFIAKITDLRIEFPRTWMMLQGLMAILMIQEMHAIVEWILNKPLFLNNTIYIYAMVPSGVTTCVLLSAVFRSRSPIRFYLLGGMFSLVGISFIPGSLDLYFPELPSIAYFFINDPFFWVILGLSIEAFCFALALAYRGRLIELENRRMQERYTHDLEIQLAERSREIEAQNQALEKQHIQQLEAEFEQKVVNCEMVALRAQMNPHFIFNCLNSIKLYTLENDSEQASEYLTKFARLIRLVLENSRSELVTLLNELEALQLYSELEAMRFKNKVRFSIVVSPEVDTQYLRIPPLLLQPFVENAIWHGLMHKANGGTVTIHVSQPNEQWLRIEITDDGIGRLRAAELKSKSAGKHKSFGMQVTADRIRMINHRYDIHTRIQVIDLIDSFGESCGTKVLVEIPI